MERDQLQARLDEVKRLRAGAATRALGLERLEHLVGELITEALIARSLDRPSRALQFLYLELGTELCKAERPEHALPLYELAFASARARTPPDRHAATLFGLRRCGCLIELLRFDDAAGALAEALELTEPLEGDAVLAAADRLTLDLHADDGRLLAAEALYWAARWLAAVGRSGAAERLAASLLERVDARPVSTLDVDEVALLLGEVRLDRGDAAGVQSMVEQRRARAVAGGARERWTVLEAICRFRAGELSAAEQSLSTSIAAAALWARAHCLATLNRVDEAEAVVQQLEAQHASRRAIEQARALIAARRTAQPDAIPTPFEILDEELRLTAPRPAPTNAATGRRHARLSDDVAERCNAIQLDLHHDELERAKRKLTELEQWLRAADSPLDLGRLHKIGAQVDYYSGRYADAGSRAERAVAVFAALAQPLDELTAWRIKRWTLERSGDDVARVADALQREAELLFAVRARLTAADRALFMLNKWSVVDEVVSERCADARRLVETAPRSVRRRARVLLRTLHDVSRLRRWEDVRAADALPDVTTKPRERRDLFTAAAEQIAAATRGPSARLPVAALPTRWLPDDTALLHFVVLPNRVELFVLHRAGVELVTPSVSSSKIQLRALLSDALQRITGATRWPGGPETERLLTELPRFLGVDRALETLPRSVKKLCIVPDDLLCNFPFAALRVDTKPLIDKFALSYLPHPAWVREVAPAGGRVSSALGVAVECTDLPGFDELTHATAELGALGKIVVPGGQVCRLHEDGEVTRTAVLARLPHAPLAHFACHGDFKPFAPHQSGLVLRREWLTVADLKSSVLYSRLIVLSTCWLGDTTVLPGRELIGVPMMLLRMGAQCVIAALWWVGDQASYDLGHALYPLVCEHGPIEALRQWQLEQWSDAPMSNWLAHLAFERGIAAHGWRRWLLPLIELLAS